MSLALLSRVGRRSRRRARPDAGQAAIVEALRAAGCSVEILSDVGRGVPDLLVGFARRTGLLEVKAPLAGSGPRGVRHGANRSQTELNDRERVWHAAWRGHVAVVRSPAEALAAVRELVLHDGAEAAARLPVVLEPA